MPPLFRRQIPDPVCPDDNGKNFTFGHVQATMECNWNRIGRSLNEHPFRTDSWRQCAVICIDTPTCRFFTWNNGNLKCNIKDNNTYGDPSPTDFSGHLSPVSLTGRDLVGPTDEFDSDDHSLLTESPAASPPTSSPAPSDPFHRELAIRGSDPQSITCPESNGSVVSKTSTLTNGTTIVYSITVKCDTSYLARDADKVQVPGGFEDAMQQCIDAGNCTAISCHGDGGQTCWLFCSDDMPEIVASDAIGGRLQVHMAVPKSPGILATLDARDAVDDPEECPHIDRETARTSLPDSHGVSHNYSAVIQCETINVFTGGIHTIHPASNTINCFLNCANENAMSGNCRSFSFDADKHECHYQTGTVTSRQPSKGVNSGVLAIDGVPTSRQEVMVPPLAARDDNPTTCPDLEGQTVSERMMSSDGKEHEYSTKVRCTQGYMETKSGFDLSLASGPLDCFKQCAALLAAGTGCLTFTYTPDDGQCLLYRVITPTRQAEGLISGQVLIDVAGDVSRRDDPTTCPDIDGEYLTVSFEDNSGKEHTYEGDFVCDRIAVWGPQSLTVPNVTDPVGCFHECAYHRVVGSHNCTSFSWWEVDHKCNLFAGYGITLADAGATGHMQEVEM